jgi:hypothetical protein
MVFHTYDMVLWMKTTLIIPDAVIKDVKRHAAERGETISTVVTEFLVQGLREPRKPRRSFRFPTSKMGPPRVDIADRNALYHLLDAERDARLYGVRKKN